MQNQTIKDQIVLRYSAPGHARFALPAYLCTDDYAAVLEDELRKVDGVYRATVYKGNRKLSVRYTENVCDLKTIARRLDAIIDDLAMQAITGKREPALREETLAQRLAATPAVQGITERYRRLKSSAALFSRLAGAQLGQATGGQHTEKVVINFLNDVLTFYLIKVHWELITKQWLKQPLRYRYQWLSTIYLLFLLVRSRRPDGKR